MVSIELVVSRLEASSFDAFLGFCRRGPVGFVVLVSAPSNVLAFSRPYPKSPLTLGREEDKNGDIAGRLTGSVNEFGGFGAGVLEVLAA